MADDVYEYKVTLFLKSFFQDFITQIQQKKMNDFDERRLKEILAFQGNVESLANPGECKQIVGSVHKL